MKPCTVGAVFKALIVDKLYFLYKELKHFLLPVSLQTYSRLYFLYKELKLKSLKLINTKVIISSISYIRNWNLWRERKQRTTRTGLLFSISYIRNWNIAAAFFIFSPPLLLPYLYKVLKQKTLLPLFFTLPVSSLTYIRYWNRSESSQGRFVFA